MLSNVKVMLASVCNNSFFIQGAFCVADRLRQSVTKVTCVVMWGCGNLAKASERIAQQHPAKWGQGTGVQGMISLANATSASGLITIRRLYCCSIS